MNKIIKVVSLVVIFYIFYKSFLKKDYETMKCDLDRPHYNNFFKHHFHLIKKYNFKENELSFVKGIFSIKPNKHFFSKDEKKIKILIKINNFENSKNKIISAINEILNSNRIWDDVNVYKVDENTKLSQIRHIWLLDKLLTDLKCATESKDIISHLKKNLVGSPLRLCSKDRLLKICSRLSTKPKIRRLTKEILNEEESDFILNKIKDEGEEFKSFEFGSIKENVEKFGIGYFESNLDEILKSLFEKFEDKYSRPINTKDRNDIRNLVLLYIPDLKKLINEDLEMGYDNEDKIKVSKNLELNKHLFYLLKHQYKIISIYNLINKMVKDENERMLAYECCSNNKSSGKCYDFNKGSYSLPIVYGFNKYGYVKDTKCTAENQKQIFDEQELTMNQTLEKNKNWNLLDKKVKGRFFKNFKNLINYFSTKGSKFDDVKNKKIYHFLEKLDKSINKIFPDKLDLIKDLIHNKTKLASHMIESIQMANKVDVLFILSMEYGIGNFKFESLNNDISKIKLAMIKLIEVRHLLRKYKANILKINDTLSKMLVLKSTNDNYRNILSKGGILNRYHDTVLIEFQKILSEISTISIDKISSESKPIKAIHYKEIVFPMSSNLDMCQSYKNTLRDIRNERAITTKEHNEFKTKIKNYCNEKNFEIKSSPLIFKDKNNRFINVDKTKIKDKNNNEVSVFVRKNSQGDEQIYNLKDKVLSETNLILDEGQLIDENSREKSKEISVYVESEDEEGNYIQNESVFIAEDDVRKESKELSDLIYDIQGI